MTRRKPLASQPLPLEAGERGKPLAAVDVAWLRMDEPANLMHIHGVLALKGEVTWDQAARRFEERLLAISRFRQRVAQDDGRFVWVEDADFDLERHLVEERLPEPGGDRELAAAIAGHLHRQFDRGHPLWEFRLIQGYNGRDTVIFGRLHHTIGDGVALMIVLLALTDLTPGGPQTVAAPDPSASIVNPFLEILLHPATAGAAAARSLVESVMPETLRLMLAPVEAFARANPLLKGVGATGALGRLVGRPNDPKTRFKGALGVEKRVAWTEKVPLEDVKRIGRQLGGTINDVLNTAMAGGLRRYLARHGEPAESLGFRAAMPVNLRPLDEMADLGNRFGLIFLKLPVGLADPLKRLVEFQRRSTALKSSAEPLVVYSILQMIGRLPELAHRAVVSIFQAKATAVFTNVPGPKKTLYFAGKPLQDIFFWVPQAGRLGLGVSIFSYDGQVRMGVGTDYGLVPDPERIVDGFHAELERLATLAERG